MHITSSINSPDHDIHNNRMLNNFGENERTIDKNSTQSNMQIRCDRVTISSYGRNMSKGAALSNKISNALEGLMKQKENLLQHKNDLISNMLEQNCDSRAINDQIKEIDKQLKDLEKEMAKIHFDEQRKKMGFDEESQKRKTKTASANEVNSRSNSKVGVSSELMSEIVSSNSDLEQIEFQSTIKDRLEGKARILKSEIKTDEARSLDGKAAENKYKKDAEFEERISTLTEDIAKKVFDLAKRPSENADNKDNTHVNTEKMDENNNKFPKDKLNSADVEKGTSEYMDASARKNTIDKTADEE